MYIPYSTASSFNLMAAFIAASLGAALFMFTNCTVATFGKIPIALFHFKSNTYL